MKLAERDKTLLQDMLAACLEIRVYVGRQDLDAFLADGKTYRAVERCLEIVGEAARSVSEECRAGHGDIPWRKVIGLRNVISHEYGDIDYEGIFTVATDSIPRLIGSLERCFAQ